MNGKYRIELVLDKVNWKSIKDYHQRLNIFWEIERGNKKVHKLPDEEDLKDELRSILHYMHDEQLEYLSYGNWVIFWSHNETEELLGEIRVIFRVSDYTFNDNQESQFSFERTVLDLDAPKLQSLLKSAIDVEDYERAAIIRDRLQELSKSSNA